MKVLKEIERCVCIGINRHSERKYEDQGGNLYVLSRTLDGCPPFFEAYGPYGPDHEGMLPRLCVAGKEYWGDGWTWQFALKAFCKEVHGRIKHGR